MAGVLSLAATYVLAGSATRLSWHPGGNYLAYRHETSPNATVLEWNGSNALSLAASYTLTSAGNAVDWHPDGAHVFYYRFSGQAVLSWNGSALSVVATYSSLGTVIDAEWAPSGDHIAVATGTGATILAWNGSNSVTLAATYALGSTAFGVAWHPGESYVAFGAQNTPQAAVLAWNGSNALTLAATYTLAGTGNRPSWHPSGDLLAYGNNNTPGVTVLTWNGSNALTLAATYALSASGNQVDWHDDGEHLAVAGVGSPYATVLAWNGSALTLAATYTLTGAANGVEWHPSGDYLAFAVNSSPHATVLSWSAAPPPPTAEGGGEASVEVSTEGAGSKHATGGGEAAVEVSTEGTGSKLTSGGAEATIHVTTDGAGAKHASGGGEATVEVSAEGHGTRGGGGEIIVEVSTEGAGQKQATGGGATTVEISVDAGGAKHASGGAEATVEVSAEGAGDRGRRGGGSAAVQVSADGGGVGHPEVFALSRSSFYRGQSVVITGHAFGSTPAKVELSDSDTYGDGTLVEQTVSEWLPGSIRITVVQGELSLGPLFLFVSRNPTSGPVAVTLLPLPTLPPIVPTPSAAERVAMGLSGVFGPAPTRLIVERRTLDYRYRDSLTAVGAVLDGNMNLSLDNSRAVLRSVRGIELRESLLGDLTAGTFDPTTDNVAIREERLIDGEWVVFPLGLYRLEIGDTRYDRDGEPIIECQAHDVGLILTGSGPTSTYTIPAGTSYYTAATTILDALGLAHDLSDPGKMLPVTVPWPRWPATSWYRILKDLADGLNYRAPWPSTQGRFQWAPWEVDLTTAAAAVTYGDTAEPRFVAGGEPYRRRQQAGTLANVVVVPIDHPDHPDSGEMLRRANADPASPVSTVHRPARPLELRYDSAPVATRCMLDVDTARDVADTLLGLEAARYGTATLTTLSDPRRGAHEYCRVTLTHPDGSPIEANTLWRVASWSRDLRTGGLMTHQLERVAPVTVTDAEGGSS